MNMASVVVLLPGLNPNCMSSRLTRFLIFLSITLSKTFITWSSSFIPLYEPQSRASPLPLYTLTIQLFFQSVGILPSFTIALNKSVNQETPVSPDAVNISDTKPVGPAALPTFVFATATRTSSSVIRSAGPLVGLASSKSSLFHSNSSFSSFSKYSFHTSFILESSTAILPSLSFTEPLPTTSYDTYKLVGRKKSNNQLLT